MVQNIWQRNKSSKNILLGRDLETNLNLQKDAAHYFLFCWDFWYEKKVLASTFSNPENVSVSVWRTLDYNTRVFYIQIDINPNLLHMVERGHISISRVLLCFFNKVSWKKNIFSIETFTRGLIQVENWNCLRAKKNAFRISLACICFQHFSCMFFGGLFKRAAGGRLHGLPVWNPSSQVCETDWKRGGGENRVEVWTTRRTFSTHVFIGSCSIREETKTWPRSNQPRCPLNWLRVTSGSHFWNKAAAVCHWYEARFWLAPNSRLFNSLVSVSLAPHLFFCHFSN